MATDTRADTSLTLAELCQAIADGDLPYTVCDEHYLVRASDARRMHSSKSSRRDIAPRDLLIEPAPGTPSLNVGCSA